MGARRFVTSRTASGSSEGNIYPNSFKRTFRSAVLTLAATGDTDADIGTIDLTNNNPDQVTKCLIIAAYVHVVSAAGTVAAAVLDIRTAAAGGGSSIITAGAVTGLTAADKVKALTVPAQTDVFAADKLYVRQTTDSANAGTIRVVVEVVDFSVDV